MKCGTRVVASASPIVDQQFLENLAWTRGRHGFKFGAEYRMGAND